MAEKAIGDMVIPSCPIIVADEGVFDVQSSWRLIEDWMFENFGKPTGTVLQDIVWRQRTNASVIAQKYTFQNRPQNRAANRMRYGYSEDSVESDR